MYDPAWYTEGVLSDELTFLPAGERMAIRIKAEQVRTALREGAEDLDPLDKATLYYDAYLDNPNEITLRRLVQYMEEISE